MLDVWLRNLLGGFSDEACLGDVFGSGSALGFWVGKFGTGFEAFGDDLAGCLAVEDALAAAVVGGVEAAQELLEVAMGVDGVRWPPSVGQFDGLDKLGPGCRQAASLFASFAA